MITTELTRSGDDYVVAIPREEVERLGLHAGQRAAVEVRPAESGAGLAPEVQAAYEESFRYNEAGLRYLAGR